MEWRVPELCWMCHCLGPLSQSCQLIDRVAIGQQEVYMSERRKAMYKNEDSLTIFAVFTRTQMELTNQMLILLVITLQVSMEPVWMLMPIWMILQFQHLIIIGSILSNYKVISSLKIWSVISTAERNCRRQFQDLTIYMYHTMHIDHEINSCSIVPHCSVILYTSKSDFVICCNDKDILMTKICAW